MTCQAIVAEGNECTINGLKVQIKPHHNKDWRFGGCFGRSWIVCDLPWIGMRKWVVDSFSQCCSYYVVLPCHLLKETKEEVLTDLFVAWGRQASSWSDLFWNLQFSLLRFLLFQVEKVNPLSEQMIAKCPPSQVHVEQVLRDKTR